MTRAEANAEARRRNAELPDGSDARWLPRKGRDADWTVIQARIPAPALRRPRGEAIHPPMEPPHPDPPQTHPTPRQRGC